MKICENCDFRHIPGIFGRKYMFFENRTLSHFRYYYFASVCKISLKNMKYSSRNSRNRLFRRFLESSGFKNQFYWQLNRAWWWELLSTMFLCEKTTKFKEKVQWKSAKTVISGIVPAFLAGKKIFSKIGLNHVLGIPNTHHCAKNQKKTNDEISRKCQKTGFSGIFPAFSPGNFFSRKSGSVTFWALPFCIIVPKIRKN